VQDEPIIVTATRSGSEIEEIPVSVSVVEQEAIAEQLQQNRNVLTSLEALVPGLNVQNSENRGSCQTRVRGRAVSFQVNGVPVNEDLRQGSCTGPFTISPFAIARIEVVRGGTALYGAGSPGGIINLVTRRGSSERLSLDATAQTSFNTADSDDTFTTDLYLGAGQRVGAFDYYVGAAVTDGGLVRDAEGDPVYSTAFDAIDLLGSFGLELPAGSELRLTTTFHDEDVGASFYPSGRLLPGTDISEIVPVASHPQIDEAGDRNVTAALRYTHPDLLAHAVDISLFYQDQSIRQRDNFFDAAEGDFFFATNRENSRLGFRSALVRSYGIGAAELKTSYGFDFTRNSFLRFTVDPAQDQRIIGYISPQVVLRTYAFFGQAELSVGDFTLTGGARHELYRGEITDEGFVAGLPGAATPGAFGKSDLTLFNAGMVYRLTEGVQLYAGFSQGAELSQLGRAARGLRDASRLTPEPATSDQYEAGIRGRAGALRFGLAGYYSTSESAALLQADPSCGTTSPICPLIPLRVPQRFHGFEANAEWAPSDTLSLSGIVTYQRGKVFDRSLDRFINYATDVVVPLRITARAEWRPIEPLKLAVQANHYGASGFFSPAEEGLGFIESEAVTLLSGSARYEIGPGAVYMAADNLLNESYVSPGNQPSGAGGFNYYRAPGRRLTLGYTARF